MSGGESSNIARHFYMEQLLESNLLLRSVDVDSAANIAELSIL